MRGACAPGYASRGPGGRMPKRVVERGPTEDIFAAPQQPYTRTLMEAALAGAAVAAPAG